MSNKERDKEIKRLHAEGIIPKELAYRYQLSYARISQIIHDRDSSILGSYSVSLRKDILIPFREEAERREMKWTDLVREVLQVVADEEMFKGLLDD